MKHCHVIYNDKFVEEEGDAIGLSRRQELYFKEGHDDMVHDQKQKARATVDNDIENNFVGSRVAFTIGAVFFYGIVKHCFLGRRNAKNLHIVYDNGDEEEIFLTILKQLQKLYTKEQQHDTIGNQKPPTMQQPQ